MNFVEFVSVVTRSNPAAWRLSRDGSPHELRQKHVCHVTLARDFSGQFAARDVSLDVAQSSVQELEFLMSVLWTIDSGSLFHVFLHRLKGWFDAPSPKSFHAD